MNDKPEPLWLHAYSGKENGLMVVGSPGSIRTLAQRLLSAVESPSGVTTDRWPPEIATPTVVGPYKDIPDFTLSFHLKGSAPLTEVVPHTRRALRTPLFLAVAICVVVGAVTLVRWALAWAF